MAASHYESRRVVRVEVGTGVGTDVDAMHEYSSAEYQVEGRSTPVRARVRTPTCGGGGGAVAAGDGGGASAAELGGDVDGQSVEDSAGLEASDDGEADGDTDTMGPDVGGESGCNVAHRRGAAAEGPRGTTGVGEPSKEPAEMENTSHQSKHAGR
jgi:hypothetical protein